MATRAIDAFTLERLLVQALSLCDGMHYDQVGAHVATALDALRRTQSALADQTMDCRH